MEFLVQIDVCARDVVAPEELQCLRDREARRAEELAAQGILLRLWRVPGKWANWGLWSALDEGELHEALDSLPLRPFMNVTVHPLVEHPSDPAEVTQGGVG